MDIPPPYKLQIKIGSNEFSAEGPEPVVTAAYEKWLSAAATGRASTNADLHTPEVNPILNLGSIDIASLHRLYIIDNDKKIVSLKHLPSTSTNRDSDAAMLILYGYKRLLQVDDVLVTRLMMGLRISGIHIKRLDGVMAINKDWVRKGGSRIGGRYTLNNQGIIQAENLARKYSDQ